MKTRSVKRRRWRILLFVMLPLILGGCVIATSLALTGYILGSTGSVRVVAAVFNSLIQLSNPYIYLIVSYAFAALTGNAFLLFKPIGLLLFALDPVIVQVPDTVSGIQGTYDCGTNGSGNLAITQMDQIPVRPGASLAPEPGHRLYLFEFPSGGVNVPAGQVPMNCEFNVGFDAGGAVAVDFKPVMSARAEIGGQVYYAPLLPCLPDGGDLSAVPSIQVPVAGTPQVLTVPPEYGSLICTDGTLFDYRGAGGAPADIPVLGTAGSLVLASGLTGIVFAALRRRRRKNQ